MGRESAVEDTKESEEDAPQGAREGAGEDFSEEMKAIEQKYSKIIERADNRKNEIVRLDKKIGEYQGVIDREMFNIPFDNSGPEKIRQTEALKIKAGLEGDQAADYAETRGATAQAMENTGATYDTKSEQLVATGEQIEHARGEMNESLRNDPGHAERMEAAEQKHDEKMENREEYQQYYRRMKTLPLWKRAAISTLRAGRWLASGKAPWEGENKKEK